MADVEQEMDRIRARIEQADAAIVAALDARAEAAREFLELKRRAPDAFLVLPRSSEVVSRARGAVRVFPQASLEPVFREIVSACEALVRPTRVVYAGAEGGLAHEAARRAFGASAEFAAIDDVRAVVDTVARGEASAGVVPLETSSDGAVTTTLDALASTEVKICAEITVPASFHLASRTGTAADVEKIYAPAVALAACERFLRSRFSRAAVIDVPSTAMAAQLAAEDHGAAAVLTAALAETYGLRTIQERIEDQAGVEVRFAVVGSELPARTGADRTVFAIALQDAPGALYKALRPFADRGVNLTRLESRPARAGVPWRYVFYVEADGHVTDRALVTAAEEVRAQSRLFKVLGSYPRPG
jgi:chorismate mutase/prephenate dehydratase